MNPREISTQQECVTTRDNSGPNRFVVTNFHCIDKLSWRQRCISVKVDT